MKVTRDKVFLYGSEGNNKPHDAWFVATQTWSNYWYIYNIYTQSLVKIGLVRKKGTNNYDKALHECYKRNGYVLLKNYLAGLDIRWKTFLPLVEKAVPLRGEISDLDWCYVHQSDLPVLCEAVKKLQES